MKRYEKLARLIHALDTCTKSDNFMWAGKHEEAINLIMRDAPSGSGIDAGTKILTGKSTSEKIVLFSQFHHMNDGGYYDGWTEHEVWVLPSLMFGMTLKLTGRNRNDIKDYLYDVYHSWLTEEVGN